MLLLLLLIALLPAAASYDLDMMIGNDNLTYGLARNNDDGKSFGSKIDLGLGRHELSASLSGMTVKGYHTDRGDVRGRYDSFNFGYSYLFEWNMPYDMLFLKPYAGLTLIGNMGMDWIQNAVHTVLGKKKVDLPYDIDGLYFYPAIGLEAGYLHDMTDDIRIGIYDKLTYRMNFGLSNDMAFIMSLNDKLDIRLGYSFEKNLTGENDSHEVQAIRNTGFMLSSSVHAGLFAFEFRTNFSKHISYGLIGFNPLAFLDMESFDDTGISYTVGVEYGYPGYMHRLILADHNLQFRCKYAGGETVIGSERRTNDASFAIGYDFIWDMGSFSPFVAPWAGMSQYMYFSPNWQTNRPDVMIEAYRPAVGCDVGVRMMEKGMVCIGGAGLSLDLGLSLAWNIGASTIDVSHYDEYRSHISPVDARVFLDLVFHI